MLVSTMVLIPPHRTKFLRCYRKANRAYVVSSISLASHLPRLWQGVGLGVLQRLGERPGAQLHPRARWAALSEIPRPHAREKGLTMLTNPVADRSGQARRSAGAPRGGPDAPPTHGQGLLDIGGAFRRLTSASSPAVTSPARVSARLCP